jgi:hypothetical protein
MDMKTLRQGQGRMIGSRNNRKNLEEDILLNMEDDIVDEKIEE